MTDLGLTETSALKRVFDGANETAAQIYRILWERLTARGLLDALAGGPVDRTELQRRLEVDPRVTHRFELAIQALHHLGTLEVQGTEVRVRSTRPPDVALDHELIGWTFGPLLDSYLEMYRTDAIFDPSFALAFDEGMDEIWDGLLNAPINLVPRDTAVEWVSTPGGRVLDLGFGTPYTLRQLAERNAQVCGLDISTHFVNRARTELADVTAIDQLVCADVNDGLGMFDDDSFDGVMFMGALHFVADPAALAREIGRVVRRRGRLVVGMFFTPRRCYAAPAFQLHRSFFDPPGTLHAEADVVAALRDVGFDLGMSMNIGSYCTLYLDHRPEVSDLPTAEA